MELTLCPQCGAPAEVTWRFAEESTDGPVEHVRVRCLNRHWFMGPADSLLPADRSRTGSPGSVTRLGPRPAHSADRWGDGA